MLAIFLLSGAACIPQSTDTLVGLWESRDTSRGGIGHVLEFRRDGTAVASSTVIVDLYYRVVRETLFVGEAPDPPTQSGRPFQIHGRTLIETQPDGTSIKKERLSGGSMDGHSLVGTWRYHHYTDAVAYERYTDDGRLLFRLPMSAYIGCYEVSGKTLSMTAPTATTASFEIRDQELILTEGTSDPIVYRRVAEEPWYPRDPKEIRSR